MKINFLVKQLQPGAIIALATRASTWAITRIASEAVSQHGWATVNALVVQQLIGTLHGPSSCIFPGSIVDFSHTDMGMDDDR
ncbi:hypothetical protein [Mycobacterium persicum]|uniref:hypothetical protein n=1 Tax=Mycobacterium persicum TaxID=1487726 RepID=UPI0009F26434|nr:hypothetical protein [Mycobacterium persicum]ORB39325.1 hypothetical protein BST40_22570 [Mycobacterium persicum]